MPYFLLVERGIGVKGYEYDTAPGEDWVLGVPENYLQAWDGKQWIDTPTARNLRAAQLVEQAALRIAEENKRKERNRVEIAMAALILKVNEVIGVLNSRGEKIALMPIPNPPK